MKGERGRPRKAIDLTVVRRAASLGCTNEEIAVLAGIQLATVYRRLEKDRAFQRVIEEGREQGRTALRRLQWQRANAGSDTMLIWLGKQLLGQTDRMDATARVTHTLGGVDRPPPLIDETDADWLERRRAELAALEFERKRQSAQSLIDEVPAASESRH